MENFETFAKRNVNFGSYQASEQELRTDGSRFTVHSAEAIRSALLSLVYDGRTEGTILFDSAYVGDPAGDLENACWTVRTEDALCVYCVENISYDFNKIVTINEADLEISYSKAGVNPERVIRLGFSSEADGTMRVRVTLVERSRNDVMAVEVVTCFVRLKPS